MKYDFSVFQEPRGVMRVFQFIFAVAALYTTVNFNIDIKTQNNGILSHYSFEYPFRFGKTVCNTSQPAPFFISADVSADARFFVATAVLSILYCVFISAIYSTIDEVYTTKPEIPLADFMLTAILAVFWFAAAVAWSNGASGLKTVTDPIELKRHCPAFSIWTSSFSGLNISLLIGYLNFFLWGSDLWFLYKETHWFKERQHQSAEAIGGSNMNAPNI